MANGAFPQDPALTESHGVSAHPPQRLLRDNFPRPSDHPSLDFWQHTLEIPADRILKKTADPAFWDGWLKRRNARQIAMLRHLVGLPADTSKRDRKAELCEHVDGLGKFALAAEFAARKSRQATVEVATGCVDPDVVKIAEEPDGRFDTTALVFAILDSAWPEVQKVFHMDRLHKAGFARMRLPRPPRRPNRRLKHFVESDDLAAVLRRFDADQRDQVKSELQQVIELEDALVVFIRRPHQQSFVLADNDEVVHGFTADQIVLHFRDEAARLNVASHNNAASYDIANCIATAFYGRPCEYENISEETYPAQITLFLERIRAIEGKDFRLVELAIRNAPLTGAPDMSISNGDNLSIGPALGEFEQAFRWSINDLDRIPRFKILFCDKRLSMEIEPIEDTATEKRYVLRYRDQTLSLGERQIFETRMEQEHGIKVVSTEKSGARHRRG